MLRLDWCDHKAAKLACERWHYSRCIPKSKLAKIGVWENEKFIGAVIYGVGATSDLVKRYGLKKNEGCELVRVALKHHQAEVSKIIAISLRILKKEFVGLRLIVSFADPDQGHIGGIYQAGNWIYCGRTQASDEYVYRGRRYQGRSFRNSYKGMEKDPRVTVIKGSSKYRYLMPLDGQIKKEIIQFSLPFPKRASSSKVEQPTIQSDEGGAVPTDALQTPEEHGTSN